MENSHLASCFAVGGLLLLLVCTVDAKAPSQCYIPNYRILTTPLPSFVDVIKNGTGTYYSGFLIDLLYLIANSANFTFTITLGNESDFGKKIGEVDGISCYNGGVGLLQSEAFDIFAAALDNVPGYTEVLDFTVPIYRSDVQVIYNTRSSLHGAYYAIMANTASRDFLQTSNDPKLQAIWTNIEKFAPTSLPNNYKEAVELVRRGGWAFIGRTPLIDQTVCSSNGLIAKHPKIYKTTYASFAVQKGSHLLNKLNSAILELQNRNIIKKLLTKWFPCSDLTCA